MNAELKEALAALETKLKGASDAERKTALDAFQEKVQAEIKEKTEALETKAKEEREATKLEIKELKELSEVQQKHLDNLDVKMKGGV